MSGGLVELGAVTNTAKLENAVKRRSWHMWGAAVFVGICILLASNQIAVALNSYCPEDTGVVLRLS